LLTIPILIRLRQLGSPCDDSDREMAPINGGDAAFDFGMDFLGTRFAVFRTAWDPVRRRPGAADGVIEMKRARLQ
jgi:hypothetical protein